MSLSNGSRSRLNLEQQRKRAKDLRRAHQHGSVDAAARIARHLPRAGQQSPSEILSSPFRLSDAQLVVAREAGFPSWPQLKRFIEQAAPQDALGSDAIVGGALEGADDVVSTALDRDPTIVRRSIDVAAAVADADAVNSLLEQDTSLADRRCGARNWTPLLYLCCSRYRQGQREADEARVAIATQLIRLGADVNAVGEVPGYTSDSVERGFNDHAFQPLSGAAGRATSLALVRVLLDAGAEVIKTHAILTHAVRGGDIEILKLLLTHAPNEWFELIWALRASVVMNRVDMARLLAACGKADHARTRASRSHPPRTERGNDRRSPRRGDVAVESSDLAERLP